MLDYPITGTVLVEYVTGSSLKLNKKMKPPYVVRRITFLNLKVDIPNQEKPKTCKSSKFTSAESAQQKCLRKGKTVTWESSFAFPANKNASK